MPRRQRPRVSRRPRAHRVPHTTALRGSRHEIALGIRFLKTGAFDVQALVTVPHAKLLRALGRLGEDQLDAVEQGLRAWLGLA